MNARRWGAWLAGAHARWTGAHPRCAERDCNVMRRMWRRIGWWNGRIRLRGSSYCAPQCFESAAPQIFFGSLCTSRWPLLPGPAPYSAGLAHAFARATHLSAVASGARGAAGPPVHRRIGEWLEELGFATEQQVTAALGLQWACPVLAWRSAARFRLCAHVALPAAGALPHVAGAICGRHPHFLCGFLRWH